MEIVLVMTDIKALLPFRAIGTGRLILTALLSGSGSFGSPARGCVCVAACLLVSLHIPAPISGFGGAILMLPTPGQNARE